MFISYHRYFSGCGVPATLQQKAAVCPFLLTLLSGLLNTWSFSKKQQTQQKVFVFVFYKCANRHFFVNLKNSCTRSFQFDTEDWSVFRAVGHNNIEGGVTLEDDC